MNKTAEAQGTADPDENGSLVSSLVSQLLSKMAADGFLRKVNRIR